MRIEREYCQRAGRLVWPVHVLANLFFSFKYIPGNGRQDVVKGESFCFLRLAFDLSCRVGEYLTEGFDPGSE